MYILIQHYFGSQNLNGLLFTQYSNNVKKNVSLIHSAMDIKDLKILDIAKNLNEIPKQNGPDFNSTSMLHGGRKDRGGGVPVNSAPVTVPNKTETKPQEEGVSPVPHFSKSYGDRHMDMAAQGKGFRRRHNSCELPVFSFCFSLVLYESSSNLQKHISMCYLIKQSLHFLVPNKFHHFCSI